MDERELESVVAAEIADAVSYIDEEIGPERALATSYYKGAPFGDEDEGRSQVVSRDVHDTVNAVLPSLMRIFFGPEKVVEFVPQGPEDVESAEQATDYVNYVVTRDNEGFRLIMSAAKDALVRKTGVIKYWWDDSVEVCEKAYTGLTQEGLAMLLEDLQQAQEAELVSAEEGENGLDVRVKLKRRKDRAVLAPVPPEEFLISRRARSLDEASLVGHRSMKTVSDLVAMGYDKEEVEQYAQDGDELEGSPERLARRRADWNFESDQSQRVVLYVEAYVLVDYDGDGIAELRKCCFIGEKLIHHEPADHRPFAVLECDPEPHEFFGQSLADKTMDVQRVKSALMRNALDSLSLTVNPRTIVVENDGNLEDAMNTEIGAIMRAKTVNGYAPMDHQDVSAAAFGAIGYWDEVRENRTGMSKVSQGLDAEALQNTTATAAEGQFSRSQERIELIARVMADGLRRLYRGVLKLLVENQRSERWLMLNGKPMTFDPRSWRVDMDVTCNVGLGGGSNEQKAALLSLVLQKQEQILTTMGPDNPLCGLKQYHTTLSKLLEQGGFKNPDAFFSDPAQYQPQAPQEPQPTPEQVLTQGQLDIERMKAEKDIAIKQAELDLRREEMLRKDDLERDKLAAQIGLEQMKLQAKAESDERNAQARAEMAANRETVADYDAV